MPDLVTHTAVAYFLGRPKRFERFRIAFYFGAILPDLLSRSFSILKPELALYLVGAHTPIFVCVFCLLLSLLFEKTIRNGIRISLMAGSGAHFLMDLFQKHIGAGYRWLFPFSWKSYELGLFWPEEPLKFIPIWILLVGIFEMVSFLRARRSVGKIATGNIRDSLHTGT